MMALIGFMGIPCGLIFNWLYQRIRQWIWPLCLFLNAAGFYMVSNAHVFSALIIGCIVSGIGFGFACILHSSYCSWTCAYDLWANA
ncbi:hypothetical protein [Lactobacillus acidophilus]|uniref:hypothetical protein n=1 Tax=Lactobacillus acidophilus TaxID=1579 RepID=UPI000354F1CA|nr:hypothetical protein [Lactobacillus acidophilus]AVW87475.1 hypothetical protein LA20079_07000 [Lactobacillus acidophilus]MBA4558229.1 hypothetical protein [Lactobacillus acidophilus]MBN3466367.1 MFS transporter [Lactobacillus acidophilus]MCH5399900.1 hypothetical protein [Lactobacillus acidophilus]MCK2063909.1 hypothetical protein [Lactobacillus acidophilus]